MTPNVPAIAVLPISAIMVTINGSIDSKFSIKAIKQDNPLINSVPRKHPFRPIDFRSINTGVIKNDIISNPPLNALLINIFPAFI